MKTSQAVLHLDTDFDAALRTLLPLHPDLVLAFGAVPFFQTPQLAQTLYSLFPHACIAGCSAGGEISNGYLNENACVVTAIRFEHTLLAAKSMLIQGMSDSHAAGTRLGNALEHEDLTAVFALLPGVAINGSAFLSGLQAALPEGVAISGGLASDARQFRRTWVLGPASLADNQAVAVGMYGKRVRVACGSFAGWQTFGPPRRITRCAGNMLYELDGKRALDIYKLYLGAYAKDLPGSALLFPFERLGEDGRGSGIYRSIIGLDEEKGSLTLAGDIEPGGCLKLMHASTDMLVDGAANAARRALETGKKSSRNSLAILVSCVGRQLVMGDRTEEEVEAVASRLGANAMLTGFYSHGEISVSDLDGGCRLNNQTMAVVWIMED